MPLRLRFTALAALAAAAAAEQTTGACCIFDEYTTYLDPCACRAQDLYHDVEADTCSAVPGLEWCPDYTVTYPPTVSTVSSTTSTLGPLELPKQRVILSYKAPQRLKVACMGDSITEGSKSTPGNNYPQQLNRLLCGGVQCVTQESEAVWTVDNYGVGGRTIRQNKCYCRTDEYDEALDEKGFDVLIINLGTNDAQNQFWDPLGGYDTVLSAYQDLLRDIVERNLNPISGLFIGIPTPLPPDYDYSWNPDRTNGPLRDLCYEMVAWASEEFPTISVHAMDFWSALGGTSAKQSDYGDRVHPDDSGYALMAREAYQTLLDWRPPTLSVACLGDSITQANENVNYPRILQEEELGNLWSVTNYGVSGRTLNGNSNLYTDEPEYATFLDEGADAVIILLGTNDAQFGFGGGPDFADEAFVDAYKVLIEDIVDKTSPKAILLGVPPPVIETDYTDGKWHIPTIDLMSELIVKVKKWAKKEYKNIYVDDVDFYESLQGPDDEPDKFLSDGVHPRNKGYAKMAQVAASGLRKFRAESGLEPELTRRPTQKPTTVKPTKRPTPRPTQGTRRPTQEPTKRPTRKPTNAPVAVGEPTKRPTRKPTPIPTRNPEPTRQPTQRPSATARPTSITCPRLKEITDEEDCPDEVRFFSCDNPSLRPGDFCSAESNECGTDKNEKSCFYQGKVRAIYKVVGAAPPIPKPTRDPTRFPTPKPSRKPTPAPSPRPGEPTAKPVTDRPTLKPSLRPTQPVFTTALRFRARDLPGGYAEDAAVLGAIEQAVERAGVTDAASNARFVDRRRLQVDGLAEETVKALVDVAGVSSFDIIGRVQDAAESGALEQELADADARLGEAFDAEATSAFASEDTYNINAPPPPTPVTPPAPLPPTGGGGGKKSGGGDDAGLIAGVVIACLVAVGLCCAAGAWYVHKSKQQDWGTRDAPTGPQSAKPVPVSGWAKLFGTAKEENKEEVDSPRDSQEAIDALGAAIERAEKGQNASNKPMKKRVSFSLVPAEDVQPNAGDPKVLRKLEAEDSAGAAAAAVAAGGDPEVLRKLEAEDTGATAKGPSWARASPPPPAPPPPPATGSTGKPAWARATASPAAETAAVAAGAVATAAALDRGFAAETPEPRKRSDSYKSPEEERTAAAALLGLARKPSYKSPEEGRAAKPAWARASATPNKVPATPQPWARAAATPSPPPPDDDAPSSVHSSFSVEL